jgi:hypothetical protein
MRKILINIIEIHMNVRCAEMMSREITYLKMVKTPGFVNYKKGALDSQIQVIKLTSCLPMVGGSLQVLQLLPPLKLVSMI